MAVPASHADDVVTLIEAGVARTAERLPQLPVQEVVLLKLIRHAAGHIQDQLRARLRAHDLNETEFQTLMALFSSPSGMATPSTLCDSAHESRTNMTRILDGLVERRLIVRTPCAHDRRRIDVRLSPQGERTVLRLLPDMFPTIDALFAPLSGRDRTTLRRLLTRLVRQLHRMEASETASP